MRTTVFGLALVLAACGSEEEPEEAVPDIGGDAEGVLLEGTISDEMIEYEKIGSSEAPTEDASPETDDAPAE